ncbi:DNA polymerase III subunit delta [Hoeflea prorocentri]|uniref:DNA polymerase III subunit delta n=1 Tax=Hoeflea prorocentri TaxID=1922333 RepID=A0A9X3UPU0_9HYPH|nr:DNA polymerase III subunit delta [Hoeflea prorocentri]MCY6383179.1 DNA polymerase III subunit delta [Hoeflea prorocentri]MDA5400979.1 DNA polymerase III subunit delta [Hoeflea prorocentri]
MAQKKAHEVDGFIKRPDPSYRALLIYGPDRGLVSERAAALSRTVNVDLTDDFNVVKLDNSDLKEDPARLLDEINAIALFGGDRLIWLRGAGNDKAVVDAVAAMAADPPADTTLIIEAGDLKKGSSLRKTAETGKASMALPCYADDGRAIHALIDEELGQSGLNISPPARQHLVENLGGDRLASRKELQKLALYCHGRGEVTEEDVRAISGDASSLSIDEAVDCVLTGNVSGLDHALTRIIASKAQVFLVLQACMRQFQMIAVMRGLIEGERKRVSEVLGEYGRRVHFRRKPALEKAVRGWNGRATDDVLQHLQNAILETRKQPALQNSIARQALLAIALRSSKLTSR